MWMLLNIVNFVCACFFFTEDLLQIWMSTERLLKDFMSKWPQQLKLPVTEQTRFPQSCLPHYQFLVT